MGTEHGQAEKLPLYGVDAKLGPLFLTNSRSVKGPSVTLCVCLSVVGGKAHMRERGRRPRPQSAECIICTDPDMRMSALCCPKALYIHTRARRFSCSIFGALSAPLRCRRSSRACYRSIINAAISFHMPRSSLASTSICIINENSRNVLLRWCALPKMCTSFQPTSRRFAL
jgi:hypothetical protein